MKESSIAEYVTATAFGNITFPKERKMDTVSLCIICFIAGYLIGGIIGKLTS